MIATKILEREWTLYQSNQTVSILKVIDENTVAVARAFVSKKDKFNKKRGRNIAISRLRGLLDHRENTNTNRYTTKDEHYELFNVGPPETLEPEERDFWDRVIKPRLLSPDTASQAVEQQAQAN